MAHDHKQRVVDEDAMFESKSSACVHVRWCGRSMSQFNHLSVLFVSPWFTVSTFYHFSVRLRPNRAAHLFPVLLLALVSSSFLCFPVNFSLESVKLTNVHRWCRFPAFLYSFACQFQTSCVFLDFLFCLPPATPVTNHCQAAAFATFRPLLLLPARWIVWIVPLWVVKFGSWAVINRRWKEGGLERAPAVTEEALSGWSLLRMSHFSN